MTSFHIRIGDCVVNRNLSDEVLLALVEATLHDSLSHQD